MMKLKARYVQVAVLAALLLHLSPVALAESDDECAFLFSKMPTVEYAFGRVEGAGIPVPEMLKLGETNDFRGTPRFSLGGLAIGGRRLSREARLVREAEKYLKTALAGRERVANLKSQADLEQERDRLLIELRETTNRAEHDLVQERLEQFEHHFKEAPTAEYKARWLADYDLDLKATSRRLADARQLVILTYEPGVVRTSNVREGTHGWFYVELVDNRGMVYFWGAFDKNPVPNEG